MCPPPGWRLEQSGLYDVYFKGIFTDNERLVSYYYYYYLLNWSASQRHLPNSLLKMEPWFNPTEIT